MNPNLIRNRLTNQPVPVELARFNDLGRYVPKVGDFVMWHGWLSRWYGLVSEISGDELIIVKDGLPKLLFIMPESERIKNSVTISLTKIRTSRGGEFHVLQEGIWLIDD